MADPIEPSQPTLRGGKSVSLDGQTVDLTLSDAVFLGLRGNRSIRSAYLARVVQKFDLRVAEDEFSPKLDLKGVYDVALNQGGGGSHTASFGSEATLKSKIGTNFILSWAHDTTRYNKSSAGDENATTRGKVATFSVVQQLLRGGGYKIATASLRNARLSEQVNKLNLKSSVSETVTAIISAYYEVLRAQEQLKIARDGLSRLHELLEVNKAMIAAGRMAAFEAVQTEADVVTQELAIEEATNSLERSRLTLLQLLALDTGTRINVVDSPAARRTEISLSTALAAALEHQPGYLTKLIESEQVAINLDMARNKQLWEVLLQGKASRSPENMSKATDDKQSIINDGKQRWTGSVGVQVNIPIGNLDTKQEEVSARVAVKTQEIALADARQALELEVDNAVRELGIRWRQFEIAKRALDLSQRKLDVEREKLRAGRSSNFQVISFESDFRNAENASLDAMIAYLNTQSSLDKTLGTTLESWDIDIND
ncbi:MAG: TolC family protein [Betaproteobacteria bacterium]|nr:TolC family protein [Betaproteobacteria bacterium]